MSNIWDARESREKFYIPHVRLITALLKNQGVNVTGFPKTKRKQAMEPYSCPSLVAHSLVYSTSRRHLQFLHRETRRTWKVIRPGMEEAESDDESMSSGGEVGYRVPRSMHEGQSQPSVFPPHLVYQGRHSADNFDYASFVQSSRPEEYASWDSFHRRSWDRDVEAHERASRERREWEFFREYGVQTEMNLSYLDANQRRMRDEYNAGREVSLHVPHTDFPSLPQNTTGEYYPIPEPHHSAWIDPYQQQAQWEEYRQTQQQGQQGSSAGTDDGPFSMSSWINQMNDFFGPPGNFYYNP